MEVVEADALVDTRQLEHEEAAHDKRNWVRLTYECNDRCVFCLDSDTHDGEIRAPAEVKRQILDGRKAGATRLILSGGEPTIHPKFVEFVRLGALAGYSKVQTVTNGRMFSYRKFLTSAIDAGLGEITFSIHGPNARIHDALVGVKGAFDEEMKGLDHALEDGRVIVNIDVCVNRGNVKVLPELIETFVQKGVREFDLLQIIPFGRAFDEGRETLFYDLSEAAPYLRKAFAYSKREDMHIWLNRFPPAHTEGYEDLIQDPYKLNDEVRGRRREFERQLNEGTPLDCRQPERCKYCYLEPLCDSLEEKQNSLKRADFERVRLASQVSLSAASKLAGDPASDKRAVDGKRRLPLAAPRTVSLKDRVLASQIKRALVVAESATVAAELVEPLKGISLVDLELDSYDDLAALSHLQVASAVARDAAQLSALRSWDLPLDLIVELNKDTAAWLAAAFAPGGAAAGDRLGPHRVIVRQPTYDRLSENRAKDVDLTVLTNSYPRLKTENIPVCLGGSPEAELPTLDSAMLDDAGSLEIFRFTSRYLRAGFFTKSLRCADCSVTNECPGVHINFVRAHGYALLNPV